jgi:hypothetical protein
MTTVTEDQWLDFIVRCLEGLTERRGSASTGAGLSSEVIKVAKVEGLAPPASLARKKFSKILTQLELAGRVVKLPLPGADLLVAPADQPGLLAEGVPTARQVKPGVRRDLFAALTMVSDKRPYYDRANDSVIVISQNEPVPEGATVFPPTTFGALEDRAKRFAEDLDMEQSQRLLTALTTAQPIAEFGRVINELRLQGRWHEFRTQELTEILRVWSAENGITFQSNWLTSAADGISSKERARNDGTEISERQRRRTLEDLIFSLDEEDIRRISVPLDLVLKLIGGLRS